MAAACAGRDDGRVYADAGCDAADRGFAARFVSDTKPAGMTLQEYEALARSLHDKEQEIKARLESEMKPLRDELDSAVVVVE